jgi:tetratricopeptide (TPR) repeat protein
LAAGAYRAAAALAANGEPPGIEEQARVGLRQRPEAAVTTAYRLSLQGWRALERGDLAAAARAIEESLALQPRDPVTRYRQAKLLQAQQSPANALTVFEAIAAARGSTPPTFYASACVEAARLHEQRGDRARAVDLYRTARGVFGADQRTKETAQRALTRLSTSSPPRSE